MIDAPRPRPEGERALYLPPDRHRDDMSHNHESQNGHFDIHAAARRILLAANFEPDINDAGHKQLDALTAPAPMPAGVRDLRQLPWSSIDNTESRDLDQVEVAE